MKRRGPKTFCRTDSKWVVHGRDPQLHPDDLRERLFIFALLALKSQL
jgi:hypothetical protein